MTQFSFDDRAILQIDALRKVTRAQAQNLALDVDEQLHRPAAQPMRVLRKLPNTESGQSDKREIRILSMARAPDSRQVFLVRVQIPVKMLR